MIKTKLKNINDLYKQSINLKNKSKIKNDLNLWFNNLNLNEKQKIYFKYKSK